MTPTIAKKPVHEIKAESARKTITQLHEKFDRTICVNGCFGSSNIGQASGFIARELALAVPNAFMRCPIALDPEVEGPTQVLLYDDHQVVIDGCEERCLAKVLEKRGIKIDLSYALDEDFGWQKEAGPHFDEGRMKEIAEKIRADIEREILAQQGETNSR